MVKILTFLGDKIPYQTYVYACFGMACWAWHIGTFVGVSGTQGHHKLSGRCGSEWCGSASAFEILRTTKHVELKRSEIHETCVLFEGF